MWDNNSVEIYYENHRIALHHRSNRQRLRYNTIKEHMPTNHQAATEIRGLTEEKIKQSASRIGRYTVMVVEKIIKASQYAPQAFKTCNAIIMLQKQYDKERIDAACAHALIGTRLSYDTIKRLLKSGKDKEPLLFTPEDNQSFQQVNHENIRGAGHYQ